MAKAFRGEAVVVYRESRITPAMDASGWPEG